MSQLNLSDLADLLNDSEIMDCVHWQDIGINLGVKKSVLDAINKEQMGKIEDCKREMFTWCLRNHSGMSREKVYEAVRRANERHKREEMRKKATEEGINAKEAINQLQMSLDELKKRNREIIDNQAKLVTEIKACEKQLNSDMSKLKGEDEQWQKEATKRQKMKNILDDGEFQKHREFLRSENIHIDTLSHVEVECRLRQKLLEKEVARAIQVKSRYKNMISHDQQLNRLLEEIEELEKLLNTHVVEVYADIMTGLERLGLKTEELEKLNTQLQNLKATLHDCTELRQHCTEVVTNTKTELEECEKRLNAHFKAFINTINDVNQMKAKLVPPQTLESSAITALLSGVFAGTVAGGATGTAIMPVVGTAAGTAVGAVAGVAAGTARAVYYWYTGGVQERQQQTLENLTPNTRRMLRNCEQIRETAQNEVDHIKSLLA